MSVQPEVVIKPHANARRLTLRYDPKQARFVMTTPKRVAKKTIDLFLAEQHEWMVKQQTLYPSKQEIAPGAELLIMGIQRLLLHQDTPGVSYHLTDEALTISCRFERFPRAVKRFLQQQASDIIIPLALSKAQRIEKQVTAVTFRDTTSRWGSCARNGNLSFSWRLIMAPLATIDYVVAHEIAHLQHFDHSSNFWALCRDLSEHFTVGKHWLRVNGSVLQTAL